MGQGLAEYTRHRKVGAKQRLQYNRLPKTRNVAHSAQQNPEGEHGFGECGVFRQGNQWIGRTQIATI